MMKFLVLGFVALFLFVVSAGLSVWLNQAKVAAETASSKKGDKGDPDHAAPPLKANPSADDPTALVREQTALLKEKEARFERQRAQHALVFDDMLTQREALDELQKKIATEQKMALAKVGELDTRAAELDRQKDEFSKVTASLQKKQGDTDANERKNLDALVTKFDAMSAESAAPLLQQMADSGKLDMAARILAKMKDRQSAKVLAEFKDTALAVQLIDRMRTLKNAPPTPTAGGS